MMLWIEAKNRTTGDVEALGIWTGRDAETITVTDQWTNAVANRVFYGAGELLGWEGFKNHSDLVVRPMTFYLSALTPAVIQSVREYDPSGARVQAWRRTYHPNTGLPVGTPEPEGVGWIDEINIPRPTPGGDAVMEMTVVPLMRTLTLPSPRMKSHEAQRRRSSNDFFRKYKATAQLFDIPWGMSDNKK
jgi:hypothetical protein